MAVGGTSQLHRFATSRALTAACLALGGLALVLMLSIALFGRAVDGEPRVSLLLEPPPRLAGLQAVRVQRRSEPQASPATSAVRPSAFQPSAGAASEGAPPLQQYPHSDVPPPKIDRRQFAGTALVADPALVEATPQGPLPRIADDGRTPMAAYAATAANGAGPRIAIVLSGLGMSAKQTVAALDGLPPQVTLAFGPYTDDVQRWVNEARARGHEVLLEVPMEPFDVPDSNPGSHTLMASISEQSNTERLSWSLSRFTGYVGITNLLGGRFLADADALAPVMSYVAQRGLLFFDGGRESHSVASDIARQAGAAYVQSALAIDAIQSAMEIDARLAELETQSRAEGSSAGNGFVYPLTISRVTNWARGLRARGFVLVPPSAIVTHRK